jgi:hypothetical protein
MAGTVVADTLQAASTSTLVLKNGVANTPPTVQDSAGTEIGTFCRAWVNFNGTTVTNPASMTGVRGSFNVSSILDNGTGDYTINFTTAMPDANYSPVFGAQADQISTTNNGNVYGEIARFSNALQTSSARLCWGVGGSSSRYDPTMATVAIFR